MKQTRVLAFDVFGTVVDWHTSIAAEVAALLPEVDADAFALAWRDGYRPAMQRVMAENKWVLLDELHLGILREVLSRFAVQRLSEQQILQLNKAWHRLRPWPDTLEGLHRLKSRFMLCTLSNGNIGLLANMAKQAGLPWDCILSAENFHKYKPHPGVYLGVAKTFDIDPHEVLMVATHLDDLAAAASCGLQTAYVERPLELGPHRSKPGAEPGAHTCQVKSLVELAQALGT
jgi:2-haloacid dehalogenase